MRLRATAKGSMVVEDARIICGFIDCGLIFLLISRLPVAMSLLIIDRFWNSTNVQTTILDIPSKESYVQPKDSLCLTYDTSSLIQLIAALLVVQLAVFAVFHLRQYERRSSGGF